MIIININLYSLIIKKIYQRVNDFLTVMFDDFKSNNNNFFLISLDCNLYGQNEGAFIVRLLVDYY